MGNSNNKELKSIAADCAKKITEAMTEVEYFKDPFQHIVIDNFFPGNMAKMLLNTFPATTDESWEHTNDKGIEVKSRTTWASEFDIPDGISDAVRILNSSTILGAMSERLSIPKLISDPYYSGGGLNVTSFGGLLDIHVDGNYHDATSLHRRVNAIVYLNPNWQESWGGEFGVYSEDGEVCVKKVAPLFNRCVIFDTHDKSYHGLPNPVRFPDDDPRRSIILYYYTAATRPTEHVLEERPHSALWKSKDFHDKRGNKNRDYS